MKKTLLLSVVASTMIMAGGDIAPVEPVVVTPMVAATASGWDFSGQAVAYTQTADNFGTGSLFDDESTYRAVGAQLRAVNKDIFAGIGAGVELTGIRSADNTGSNDGTPVSGPAFYGFGGNAGKTSGGITQAYLTYGMANTSLKIGRQTLPKDLSPFAFSEGWQMFKNTFDAALVVNSDLPDTTLVYAYVTKANLSITGYADRSGFNDVGHYTAGPFANTGGAQDGVHMVTAQNKSIDGLTLTGTYYLAPNFVGLDDTNILWGDAKFKISDYTIALQGGQIDPTNGDATTAFGAKIGGNFGMFGASIAYSSVSDDGAVRISNLGTGIKSPLYTQMLLNNVGQFHSSNGADFIKASANAKVLGGKLIVSYGAATNDFDATKDGYSELDVMYKTKLTENITGFAAYGYTDADAFPDSNNFVRFWAKYNF